MARRKNDIPFSLFSFQDIITATTGILILLSLVLALSVITQGAESVVDDNVADESLVVEREQLENRVRQQQSLLDQLTAQSAFVASASPAGLSKEIEQFKKLLTEHETNSAGLEIDLKKKARQLNDLLTDGDKSRDQVEIEKRQKQIEDLKRQLTDLKKNDRLKFNFRDSERVAWLVEISDKAILVSKVGSSTKPKSFSSPFDFTDFADDVPAAEQYFVLLVKPSGVVAYDHIKSHLKSTGADLGVEVIGESQTAIDSNKGAGF